MPGRKIGGKLSAYLRRKQESRPPNPSNTYEPLSDAHAAYLKDLVKRAGKKDGTREIFGSSKHGYKLNPTVTREEVRRFEARWHLTLPDEYVFFSPRWEMAAQDRIMAFTPWKIWTGTTNIWGSMMPGIRKPCLRSLTGI